MSPSAPLFVEGTVPTCVNVFAVNVIAVLVIELTRPFAASVITGTIVEFPYTPALVEIFVTSVLALSNAA